MNENELAQAVIEIAFQIHRKWGPGLLESVYEELMVYHLKANGFYAEQQKEIPFAEDGVKLSAGFRADIIVERKLIVELKSIERTAPVHSKIVLTYLRLTGLKLGLLMNFGEALMRDGINRVVNGLR
ncbi:MAG: GxxExxY protein [Saprospiraceae bacterium]